MHSAIRNMIGELGQLTHCHRAHSHMLLAAALSGTPADAWAQSVGPTPSALTQAATTITAAELARHVARLTNDSIGGRATPSHGLEQTAQYLVAEFERLGLRPGRPEQKTDGGDSAWFQRYPLPGQHRFDYARSRVRFTHPRSTQRNATVDFISDARFLAEVGPPVVVEKVMNGGTSWYSIGEVHMGSGRTTVVSGRQTAASLALLDVGDQVVVYVPPTGVDSAEQARVLTTLYATSAGVVVVTAGDSAEFAAAARMSSQVPLTMVDGYLRDATGPQRWPWAIAVWAGSLQQFLATSGVDMAALQADLAPQAQELANTAVWLEPEVDSTSAGAAAATVPNVFGLLEGADDSLKRQYIVVSAHMDGAEGGAAGRGDSLDRGDRGGDDNAVGVAALLALARAWSTPEARPRRSVLFVATSGAGPGQSFWGSNVAAGYDDRLRYVLNSRSFVLNLTVDRIGRLRGDSVLIRGLKDIAGPVRADWLAAAHPELGLHVVDEGPAAVPDGEHFAWVRHNVPSLYVHGGHHGERAGPSDMAALDLEAAARVVRLLFHVGHEFGTTPQWPRWSDDGHKRYLSLRPIP